MSAVEVAAIIAVVAMLAGCGQRTVATGAPAAHWWKGNTHTHSLWSDGDGWPEMIADWYKRNGYQFLAMTDHNPPPPERWVTIPASGEQRDAWERYRARFGAEWVVERRRGDTLQVRARRLNEYRPLLEQAGRFLLVPGEEITQYSGGKAAHMNGINLVEPIPPQEGADPVEILHKDIAALRAQRERTGRPMIGVLNHPNFIWSQTAEDLLALPELRFFEVYNGHPLVNTLGDSLHASTERIWDIVLTHRAEAGQAMLFGMATDDAHDYHRTAPSQRNPGRGWIVVRAPVLEADALVRAMERGDFYASTGVVLADVRREGNRLLLRIEGEPGVTYTTHFIGTRRGWDRGSSAVHDSAGAPLTHRYSGDVGAVLAESMDLEPSYVMRGDELYVRARIVSSVRKSNPSYDDEVEMGWTQPVRP